VTVCALLSPGHWSEHVASVAHDSEHEPVHWMLQVEPAAHDTLPLGPTVTSHDAFAPHDSVHDSPHIPVHDAPLAQSSEQLEPAQPDVPMSHVVSAAHEQEVPVQVGGGAVSLPPQAATARSVT